MANQYKNSPLIEVLLSIHVTPLQAESLSKLRGIQEFIKKDYPEFKIKTEFKASFNVQQTHTDVTPETSGNPIGYIFSSSNLQKMIQATLSGYTFNILQPYNDWDSFKKEAAVGWNVYAKQSNLLQISRIELRYINKITIDTNFAPIDFKEYILTTPEIAPALPQSMSDFFMSLVVPGMDQNVAIITQTVDRSKEVSKNMLPLLFDIAVFRDTSLQSDSLEIWNIADSLHTYALDIFNKSLTDKTKQLFT